MSGLSLAPWIVKRPGLLRMLQPVANWYVGQAGWRKVGLRYDDLSACLRGSFCAR